jgi:sigma-B regulation protein RsbU (phosphoserine phosphatase)
VYEGSQRTLTIGNAGGTHPLLLRDGQLKELAVDGIPLGLFPEADYSILTLNLKVDDVVLFASDGILESENSKHEEFGMERLSALIASLPVNSSVENISGAILRATDEFSGVGIPPHDDRTLLVLRAIEDSPTGFSKLPVIY